MAPKVIFLSLSLDLKRITTAIQRDSSAVGKFNSEADEWLIQARKLKVKKMEWLLEKIEKTLKRRDDLEKAEECLMYSFLIQNRAILLN